MKPAKAIEILELEVKNQSLYPFPDRHDAFKLGLESLKRLLTMRSYGINQAILPLPGENPIPDLSPSADRKQKLRESPLGREPRH